ncbi:MAG: alpha/beta hydrolase, partial [Porphyromonadaceae bacterium]|nr:alpha/beta hydrolase [Porphyromonadaceae bacterium]
LQDLQRAIRYLRTHAADWGVDPTKIGVMGSSAGAHLAACSATITDDWSAVGDTLDNVSFRPDFAILVSPVVSMDSIAHKGSRENLLGQYDTPEMREKFSCDRQVTPATPPMFIVHAMDDPAVSCLNSLRLFEALKRNDIKGSSLHIFPSGGHNIALRNNPGSTNGWTQIAEVWLIENGISPENSL